MAAPHKATAPNSGPHALFTGQRVPLGTKITKIFDGIPFQGSITKYDPITEYYHVNYDDGDSEDFNLDEGQKYFSVPTPLLSPTPSLSGVERNTPYRYVVPVRAGAPSPLHVYRYGVLTSEDGHRVFQEGYVILRMRVPRATKKVSVIVLNNIMAVPPGCPRALAMAASASSMDATFPL
eukprot:scaffold53166_cov52-Attheya_sp.AAC.4